jgi:hypothetical protein
MKKKSVAFFGILLLLFGVAGFADAAVIDFTGGTAYLSDGTTRITNNLFVYDSVDYYIEDGFKYDFIGGNGIVGNYYSTGTGSETVQNDVIHAHWWGGLTSMVITKVGGGTFNDKDCNRSEACFIPVTIMLN